MTPSNPPATDASKIDIRLFLAACSVLLVITVWVYAHFLLSDARQESMDNATQDATTSVRLLAEYTTHLVQCNDQLMQVLAERHAKLGRQFDIAAYLHDTGLSLPLHTGLWLVNADGQVISSNLPLSHTNFSALESVQYQKSHPQQAINQHLHISHPLQNPDSRRWEILLSRRINASDGSYAGTIIASIDLQNFNRFYNEIHLNANDSLTLIGEDGVIRARKSGITSSSGGDVSKGRLFPTMLKEGNGMVTTTSSVDGRVRYYAYRKLNNYPLFALMGIDVEDSLKSYVMRERRTYQLAIFATLFTLVMGIVIHNLLSRLIKGRQRALAAGEIQQQLLQDMERQRTALQDSNQQLHAIWVNTADAMITLDAQYRIETINPAAGTLFATDGGTLAGQRLQCLIPDLQLPAADATLTPAAVEVACRRPDGSEFPAELAWTHFHIGTQLKWIASLRDSTGRKRIEQMKTEFVATISHELRAPLTEIRSAIEATLSQARNTIPESVQAMLESANRHGERLYSLINDLLDVHEMEAGGMHFSLQCLQLGPLLNHALNNMQDTARQHNVSIALVGSIPDCQLQVDPDRFGQVMHNLLSNACKFSHANSTVTVQAHLMSHERVRIAIIDRGVGIPEAIRELLFKKFTQAPVPGNDGKSGTGLGLTLAKAIIEHMHGEIGYHSIHGQGSTFFIELPAAIMMHQS